MSMKILEEALADYKKAIEDENEADRMHQEAVNALSVAKSKLMAAGSAKSSAKAKVDAIMEAIARDDLGFLYTGPHTETEAPPTKDDVGSYL